MNTTGCPLEEPASNRTCNKDNNGRSLDDVDCFGQENRWNNAVVAGVCKCLSTLTYSIRQSESCLISASSLFFYDLLI